MFVILENPRSIIRQSGVACSFSKNCRVVLSVFMSLMLPFRGHAKSGMAVERRQSRA